jgi:uncharacterized damage-inducible protein DinB
MANKLALATQASFITRGQRFPHCGKLAVVWLYTSRMSFGKELLLSDVHYSAWANRCVLEACAALTSEELEHDLRISHANILATLRHIYDGERVWLDRLRASAEPDIYRLPTGSAPELSLDMLRQQWPELWRGYIRWLSDASENHLGIKRTTLVPGGAEPCVSCWRILRHVLEHSTLHRGQVIGMIRTLGHTPPAIHRMDYYLAGEPITAPQSGA